MFTTPVKFQRWSMIVRIEYLIARQRHRPARQRHLLKNVKACPLQESGEWQMATHVPELVACIWDIYIYGGFGCKASTSLHVWNHLQIAKMVSLCWWLVSHRFCKTGKDFSTSFYISIQCGTQHDPAIVWLDGLIAEPASLTSQVQQLREARRFGFTMCQSQSCNTEFAYILHVNLFILFSSLPSYRSNCGRD